MDENNKTAQNGQKKPNKPTVGQPNNRRSGHYYHNHHRPKKPQTDGSTPAQASPMPEEKPKKETDAQPEKQSVKQSTQASDKQVAQNTQRQPKQHVQKDKRHQPPRQKQSVETREPKEAKDTHPTETVESQRKPRQSLKRTPRVPEPIQKSRAFDDDMSHEVIFLDTPVEDTSSSIPKDAVKVGAPDFEYFDDPKKAPAIEPDTPTVEVIGVRFRRVGKVYYFAPDGIQVSRGDFVIVETARGPEFGEVSLANRMVAEKDTVQPLRPVIRVATQEDINHNENNRSLEASAFTLCLEKIAKHKLEMKLVEAQYTFDNSKLLFYFTAAGRVDFRELVKDLASVFRTRIELRQIGIRDEAKLLGGLGACGRPLCCSSFLSDFVQVSIKMAKEQNLSLNSNKISGTCGRLMCCLRYENDTYEEEIRRTPQVDSTVRTPDGVGVVTEISPLLGMIKVRLPDDAGIKPYHRDDVVVLTQGKSVIDAIDIDVEDK